MALINIASGAWNFTICGTTYEGKTGRWFECRVLSCPKGNVASWSMKPTINFCNISLYDSTDCLTPFFTTAESENEYILPKDLAAYDVTCTDD
jgi:hypothetical protein